MEPADYPSLYGAADEAAGRAKRRYYRLLAAQLVIFVIISLTGTLSSPLTEQGKFFSRVSAFLLGVSLILAWVNRAQHYDRAWYECRAVSEAARTLTWRYMMQAQPFPPDLDLIGAKHNFLAELKNIRKAYSDSESTLAEVALSSTVFTPFMDETRQSDWQKRRDRYLKERLEPERQWYARNARASSAGSQKWMWFIILLQVGAFFFAVVPPNSQVSVFNPVSLFMTLASTITAWSQAKRQDELATSYLSAAQSLAEFQELATTEARDPASFANFVANVERSLARERATWLIQRSLPADLSVDS